MDFNNQQSAQKNNPPRPKYKVPSWNVIMEWNVMVFFSVKCNILHCPSFDLDVGLKHQIYHWKDAPEHYAMKTPAT
jgi:hypothetical protein